MQGFGSTQIIYLHLDPNSQEPWTEACGAYERFNWCRSPAGVDLFLQSGLNFSIIEIASFPKGPSLL